MLGMHRDVTKTGNGEWSMGNGNWKIKWETGNGKSKNVEIVVDDELYFFSAAIITYFGNVLRQNKGNLLMTSSKRERWPSF